MNLARFARTTSLLALAALGGCSEQIHFSDSIDLELDLFRQHDELHSPYVVGASFRLCADARNEGALSGGALRSSDASILELGTTEEDDEGRRLCADVVAREAGEVDVSVEVEGLTISSTDLEVRAPDRVELYAAGPSFVGRDDIDALVEQPQVLAGGTATFEVRYFSGQTRLHGQGALSVDGSGGVHAEAIGTVLTEDREWIRITPSEEGEHEIALSTPAGPLDPLQITVVGEEAIVDVALHGTDESGHAKGDSLVAYAQAYDEDDAPIYGVEYEWSLGGEVVEGTGDLFRYDLDPSQPQRLRARRGELDVDVEIHAAEGVVDSSNDVGCTIAGRRGGAWALLLLVAGAAARRRRRAA